MCVIICGCFISKHVFWLMGQNSAFTFMSVSWFLVVFSSFRTYRINKCKRANLISSILLYLEFAYHVENCLVWRENSGVFFCLSALKYYYSGQTTQLHLALSVSSSQVYSCLFTVIKDGEGQCVSVLSKLMVVICRNRIFQDFNCNNLFTGCCWCLRWN